jgi:zinc/manganese transport system substrate-binding protein
MLRHLLFIIVCFLFLTPHVAEAKKITIVTSFSVLGDMVRQIAGDNVTLITLVGPDSDAHVYEPTPSDIKIITQADIFIVNGLGFEGWLSRLVSASNFKGIIITASDGISPIMVGTSPDPHAWQDLSNGKIYVTNIQAALSKADPAHLAIYSANTASYLKILSATDDWVRSILGKIPQDKRRAVTSHDALRYFAKAYGVNFLSPLGNTTSSETNAHYIAEIVDLMRSKKVRAVFLENMTDSRQVMQLITDGNGIVGGILYTDALSKADGPAPTYIDMFKHNAIMLVTAMAQN